jgi:hypothetical protein
MSVRFARGGVEGETCPAARTFVAPVASRLRLGTVPWSPRTPFSGYTSFRSPRPRSRPALELVRSWMTSRTPLRPPVGYTGARDCRPSDGLSGALVTGRNSWLRCRRPRDGYHSRRDLNLAKRSTAFGRCWHAALLGPRFGGGRVVSRCRYARQRAATPAAPNRLRAPTQTRPRPRQSRRGWRRRIARW